MIRTDPFTAPLRDVDPVLAGLMAAEQQRQDDALHLLAPSMLVSRAVRDCLGASLANLDGEGYVTAPDDAKTDFAAFDTHYRARGSAKYNPSGPVAEYVEILAGRRIAAAFTAGTPLRPEDVSVNVQPASGSIANLAVFRGMLDRGDPVVAIRPAAGGHISHGAPFHSTGQDYAVRHIDLDVDATTLDLDQLRDTVLAHRPKMVIIGASSFPRAIDWRAVREQLDGVDPAPVLVADVAHFAGLVATGHYPNPLPWADVVSFVGYKTFGGPKSGVILTRDPDHARRIERALFPGIQGAPRLAEISAMAAAAAIVRSPAYAELIGRSVATASALDARLGKHGFAPAFGGTDTHMIVIKGCVQATELAKHLEHAGIFSNANMLPGDPKPSAASGLRLGTVGVCQRGLDTEGADELGDLLAGAIESFHRPNGDVTALRTRVREFVRRRLTRSNEEQT